MPEYDEAPLNAAEFLKFQAIVESSTYPEPRQAISDALRQIHGRQGTFVQDAWQRAARRMWKAVL